MAVQAGMQVVVAAVVAAVVGRLAVLLAVAEAEPAGLLLLVAAAVYADQTLEEY